MPTFEAMQKKYSTVSKNIGDMVKEHSNFIMNETFSNSDTYKKGKIYDCDMNEILDSDANPIEIEFKFLKVKTYSIDKDQVEYMVQFRPNVNPEIDFDNQEDKKHRLGYYVDILDENSKEVEKWLIVGKDNSQFDKYNVLKCNWELEWLDKNRKYHRCLGVIRDRNNYNSGVWSDRFTTTVQNQTAIILPTNNNTRTVDYGIKFMITDNPIYPKVYEITKLMDTFPLGVTHVILSQCHYNAHTDICAKIDIGDGSGKTMHMLCDYYRDDTSIDVGDGNVNWELSEVNRRLYVNSFSQTIKAINKSADVELPPSPQWHISIDGTEFISELDTSYIDTDPSNKDTFIQNYMDYTDGKISSYYLQDYLDINVDFDTLTIAAKSDDLVGYSIKIEIYIPGRKDIYYDSVEMEVCA